MAQVVLDGVSADTQIQPGELFKGLKFWLSQKVPQRSRFINDVRANGGETLPIEKHADVKIVDHTRKEALPGTFSYTFIEKSVRNGALENLGNHRAGPPEGTVRSIGSIVQPAKGTRNKYTQEDDRILWSWVHETPQKGGGTDGNEIYKQLEAKHPQHPWQSWRDRWIKQLKGKPCPFPQNTPPTPPSEPPAAKPKPVVKTPERSPKKIRRTDPDLESFDEKDVEDLIKYGDEILDIDPDNLDSAWEVWANNYEVKFITISNIMDAKLTVTYQGTQAHTGQDWQRFWEEIVYPRYLKRQEKRIREPVREVVETSKFPASEEPSTAPKLPLSPSTKQRPNIGITRSSPSYRPESPTMLHQDQSSPQQEIEVAPLLANQNGSSPMQHAKPISEEPGFSHRPMKRKRDVLEDELPSSSPPERISLPKQTRSIQPELRREIASTPDREPVPSGNRADSPLFIESEDELEEGLESYETNHANGSENDLEEGADLLDENPVNRNEDDAGQGPDLLVAKSVNLGKDDLKQGFDSRDEDSARENTLERHPYTILFGPTRMNSDTQGLFRDPTQQVDLDVPPPDEGDINMDQFLRESTQILDLEVPPPEEGWDDDDLGAEGSSDMESPVLEVYEPRTKRQGTQALFRGQSAAPDFDIAEPEGGWDEVIPSSPPAEEEESDVGAQTEEWINAHAMDGLSIDDVLIALKSTSMDTEIAETVLGYLKKEKRVPENQRGVWTVTDDEDLMSTDARNIQRLKKKHGTDSLTSRWQFLSFYAA
ncbi:hypothetical protein ACLMJK_007891 [Lecanora helva]